VLTKLSIQNFKSWHNLRETRLSRITGLFGANNTGKSSVLELLLLLKQTIECQDRYQVLHFGSLDPPTPVNLGSLKDVLFRHDEGRPLSFSVEWLISPRDSKALATMVFPGSSPSLGSLEVSIRSEEGLAVVDTLKYRIDSQLIVFARIPTKPGYSVHSTIDGFEKGYADAGRFPIRPADLPRKFFIPPGGRLVQEGSTALVVLDYLVYAVNRVLSESLFYLGPLRVPFSPEYRWTGERHSHVGYRGEKAVEALLAMQREKRTEAFPPSGRRFPLVGCIEEQLKRLNLIESLDLRAITKEKDLYRAYVRALGSGAECRIGDVGFGVSQVLPVIVLLYYVPRGSTVILEQPEIHLHPAVQYRLADVIVDATLGRELQVIVESHSEHLLNRLQRRLAEGKGGVELADVSLYFTKLWGGESRLTRLKLTENGDVVNWPRDFFGDALGEALAFRKAQMNRQKPKA